MTTTGTALPPPPPPSRPKTSRRWFCSVIPTCLPPPPPSSRPNASRRWFFSAVSTPLPPPPPSRPTKREPEVVFLGVPTRLPPPPPPSHPNASWRWLISIVSTHLPPPPPPSHPNASRRRTFGVFRRWRVSFPRYLQRRGGVKPTHRPVQKFPCPLGFLGRHITWLPCLPPPNNNEGASSRRRQQGGVWATCCPVRLSLPIFSLHKPMLGASICASCNGSNKFCQIHISCSLFICQYTFLQ